MPSKDFIVKLAGDSKSYQSAMDQAAKSLDKFQKQNLSTDAAMKSLTSTLSKYISVAALAKGAVDAFTATMRGSQTTSDRFDASMRAAKTAVNTFFSSLSTGDFTQFNLGLENLIRKSREAYDAIDRLGNASMSWGYFQNARMADLTELQAIVNDKSLPMAQRKEAAAQMKSIQQELQGYATGYEQRAIEAMARVMTEATNLDWKGVSRTDLEKVLSLDLLDVNMSASEKERLATRYQNYLNEVKQYEDWFDKEVRVYEKRAIKDSFGATVAWGKVEVTPQEDLDLRARELQEIATDYQDAVLYQQILERGSDEWLQNLIQLVQQADAAARAMKRVNSSVLQAQNLQGDEEPVAPAQKPMPAMDHLASGIAKQAETTNLQLTQIDKEGFERRLELAGNFASNYEQILDFTDLMTKHADTVMTLSGAFAQLGGAMAGTGNKAAASAGAILQAVNQALPALQTLFTSASSAAVAEGMAETPTAIGKIAAAISLGATIISTVSSLKSIQTYAEGGIVPGKTWNDSVTARVSSGEMVINEADQKRLYDSIHSGNLGGGGGGPAVITGEQIVLAINNYGRRIGKGELLFAGG